MKNVRVEDVQEQGTSHEADLGDKVAILLFHGMGQPVQFETLDGITSALLAKEAKGQGEKKATVKLVEDGGDLLPRAEIELTRAGGVPQDVHLFEAYWAPLTEGKVSATETLMFLLAAGWRGIKYSRLGHFQRQMFGEVHDIKLNKGQNIRWLALAFAVVLAAALLFFTFLAVIPIQVLIGFGADLLDLPLIRTQTSILIAYFLTALILLGLGLWFWKSSGGLRRKLISPLATLVAIVTTTAGGWAAWYWYAAWSNPRFLEPNFSEWIGTWPKLVYVVLFALALWLAYYVRWFFVQYLGDVAIYVSSHKVNKFHEVRRQIHAVAKQVARHVYSKDYKRVIVVGHSLGSVVAYDALNFMINEDKEVFPRTELFVTFGSPLDKIAFMFRTQARDEGIRAGLNAAQQPMIRDYGKRPDRWINLHSPFDIISGPIDFFDPPRSHAEGDDGGTKRVENRIDPDASTFLVAHVEYWKNPMLVDLIHSAATTDDRE